MSKKDIYIDWSKAPEGTTHVFVGFDGSMIYSDGTPKEERFWERWEDGDIYEYRDADWNLYNKVYDLNYHQLNARIEMPLNTTVVNSLRLPVALPDGSVTSDYLVAAQQWAAAFYELKDTLAQVKGQMKSMIENVDEILDVGED